MTVDEYADLELALGSRLHQVQGIWWKEIRPCFFRPLFPLAMLDPQTAVPPWRAMLGGYQHPVPVGAPSNSQANYIVFDDLQNYSFGALSRNRKKKIHKAQTHFHVQPIPDKETFIEQAYPVYLSFQERTGYGWKRERTEKEHFAHWASILYRFPKLAILGTYDRDRLAAVEVAYRVEDTVLDATSFAHSEYLSLDVGDLVIHHLRESLAAQTDIRCIFLGTYGEKQSLDAFKINIGGKVTALPAYYRLNPAMKLLMKLVGRKTYRRLQGCTVQHLRQSLTEQQVLADLPVPGQGLLAASVDSPRESS